MKNKTIQTVTAKQLLSVIPRAETVSVKVSHDHLVTLDNLAAQCGKSRGAVAKIILELGILQMGYDWKCLPDNLQDVYTGILVNSNNQK